ncbi:hypothetical protein LCGC14_2569040, partial [marine sediment metagenome]
MQFVKCFDNINSYQNQDILEDAYVHYLIGNYRTAAKKQLLATIYFSNKYEDLSNFISQYNSLKLFIFVRNSFYKENYQDNLLEELKQIDLNYAEINLSDKQTSDFRDYLKNDEFYINARDNIQSSTSKIIDNYHSQLNGGWSYNNEIWILINEFAKLESFLSANFIIYDKFKEFGDVFTIFM